MTSSILTASFRVSSYWDPGSARKRITNWPASTCGNNSHPTWLPTSQKSSPQASEISRNGDRAKPDHGRHDAIVSRQQLAEEAVAARRLMLFAVAGMCRTSHTESTGTSVLESR